LAKLRHKLFEMYEFRDEAVLALTSSNAPTRENDLEVPESSSFTYLNVSVADQVTVVQFKGAEAFELQTAYKLQSDFKLLADQLARDSKVLFDFDGVKSFGSNSIGILAAFNQTLRNRGSRIGLCCLEPEVQRSFFA
jgi:anti-anti-sigma factor